MKKQRHYCKICGEYKSNESFSGKGHAAHICKKCSSLSPVERSCEMTLTRMTNLPWDLSKEQKAWLKGLQNDRRTDIAEMAKELYAARFPFAERNEQKKQLHIRDMTFTVQGELTDEYGEYFEANLSFALNHSRKTIVYSHDGITESVELTDKEMKKLLNRIVNEYEVFCWEEDFSYRECISFDEEEEPASWTVEIRYQNGEQQSMKGDDIPYRVDALATELLEYFEESDEFDDFDEE